MSSSSDSQGAIFWDRLRPLFAPDEQETRPGGEQHRWGLAVTLSVLLSFVLWLTLTLGEPRTVTIRLPVKVVDTPEGQALAEIPPSTVRVRVKGSGLELLRLIYGSPVVKVDGTTSRVNVREQIKLPSTVEVKSVTPGSFDMKLDPVLTRQIPVRSRVKIDLAAGHELIDDPQLHPDSVHVEGAESIVKELDAWPTKPKKISNLEDTVKIQVPLADSLDRLVQTSAEKVSLVARAGRFAEETREVKVQVIGVPSGQNLVALQPPTIRIRYRVLFKHLFKARRSSEFFATVSYDQIRSDTTGYVKPRVHVPSDLLIRDPEPIPPRLRYYTFLSGE